MGLPKYGAKRDENELEIVRALEAIGCTVVRLDTPADLLCGFQARNYLLECKQETGRLTPPQKEFFKHWKGQVRIVHSPEEAIEVVTQSYQPPPSVEGA